jgi:ABC-2 type transport system permease protein
LKSAAEGRFAETGRLFEWMGESGISLDMLASKYIQFVSPMMMAVLFGIIFTVGSFVAVFYLLDSLYAERKNRSILFWKSLPISDTETVLSKLVAATVLVPIVALVAGMACWMVMQVIASVAIGMLGGNGWAVLWQPGILFDGIFVAIKSSAALLLWYLPIAGWLLLVSVWARRSVFLWAVLPPVAIVFVEHWLFGSEYFAILLGSRIVGFRSMFNDSEAIRIVGSTIGEGPGAGLTVADAMNQMVSFSNLLSEPGLYGGIVVAAGFITGAIFLRRYRDET